MKNLNRQLNTTRMKNLKTIIVATVFAMSTGAYAQVSFGIKAGLNLSDMNGRIDGIKDSDTKTKPGFNIGGLVDYSFTDVLGLETGLILDSKGYEYRFDNNGDFSSSAEYGKLVTNVMYLDIPINLKAQFDVGKTRVFGLFGPYIGIALSGKIKAKGDLKSDLEQLGIETEESIEFGGSETNDNLKRFDFGLMLGAGVGIKAFEISTGYDFGLVNILPGGDSDNYIKNGLFKLSLAYFFGIESGSASTP